MRFLFKFLSLLFLSVAIIAGVVDALQSVALDKIVLTSFGETWFEFHPGSLNLSQALIQRYVHPMIWDPGVQWVLLQPTIAVFLVLAFLFYILSYRRKRPEDKHLA